MLKQGRNTQKEAIYIVQPGLTYGSQYLEVDLEASTVREEPIGPEPSSDFTDCLEACILNSLQTICHRNQPR